MAIHFPRPLRPGDRIGVTSPSAGASGDAATRIEFCVDWLRGRGYDVVVGECMDGTGLISAPAEQRAAELTRMLADPDIHCVVPPWGGETAIDLVDLLDYDALAALLDDASFMPNGGTLGFGLRHKYPFETRGGTDASPLKRLRKWLKGGDDALFRACGALGLAPYFRLVITGDDTSVLVSRVPDPDDLGQDMTHEYIALDQYNGVRLLSKSFGEKPARDEDDESEEEYDEYGEYPGLEVYWVTESTEWNALTMEYVAMGNEATLAHAYMEVCMLVEVGPPGKRVPESGGAQDASASGLKGEGSPK